MNNKVMDDISQDWKTTEEVFKTVLTNEFCFLQGFHDYIMANNLCLATKPLCRDGKCILLIINNATKKRLQTIVTCGDYEGSKRNILNAVIELKTNKKNRKETRI